MGKNNTGIDNSGDRNSGDRNSGDRNSGDRNSGDRNSGDWNSGDRNSGDWNSGDRNSGYWNSGYRNSGDWNSGDWNSGDWNSGNWNSGYWNSGNRNSGYRNSGDWNSGNRNSGYLNTDEPKVRIFNRETDLTRDEISFPNFFYFDLTKWVNESDMTKKEKEENDQYKVTGGYLKVLDYKEAWRESWENASAEDRRKVLDLPNWDNELFKEITGIDVEKELLVTKEKTDLKMEIELNGKKYRLVED